MWDGERFRFGIGWRKGCDRKSHAVGSRVPALAKIARTGHPRCGKVGEIKSSTPRAPEGWATRPGSMESIGRISNCVVSGCGQVRWDDELGLWEDVVGWEFRNKGYGNNVWLDTLTPIWGEIPDPNLAGGPGMAPQASGAAQAAKDAAKNFMKSTKPDPPLRGVPSQTPEPTKLSPLRQLMKDALDVLGGTLAGAANGSTEILIIVPVPQVIIVPPDQMPDAPYRGPA